jgi:hypothetical protein
MKYLFFISIVWALALCTPNFYLENRKLNMMQDQIELQKKAMEIKKIEMEIISRMTPEPNSSKSKKEDAVF